MSRDTLHYVIRWNVVCFRMRKSLVAASGLDGLLSVIVIAGLNEPRFLSMTPDLVAPQLIVVTHTSARSDVAGPVKDAHDALVVPSELAGHETTAVRVSSSDDR